MDIQCWEQKLAIELDVYQHQDDAAVGYPDLLIAATAAHHGLTVLTRNLRHFAPLTVREVYPVA